MSSYLRVPVYRCPQCGYHTFAYPLCQVYSIINEVTDDGSTKPRKRLRDILAKPAEEGER